MDRKLQGMALLGTHKGFPSAKVELRVRGRNDKGIRSECTPVAERAAERYMKVQWSWTPCLCGHQCELPGLGYGPAQGSPELGEGEPSPLAL